MARKHHPDKGGDAEDFKALASAYEILIDEPTRASYDRARKYYAPEAAPEATPEAAAPKAPPEESFDAFFEEAFNSYQKTEPSEPPRRSTMIFNTTHHTNRSDNTSLTQSSNTNNIASAGINADDMSADELGWLAMKAESVALGLLKNSEQLKRVRAFISVLAEEHASFAYQILACPETRAFLCSMVCSYTLAKLFKNDYNLLLLVVSSDELTKTLLSSRDDTPPPFNGTQLHDIYHFHLKNRGSCQAFELLLETNEQLKKLFDNHTLIQSSGTHYELQHLLYLDHYELSDLALKHQTVAVQIIHNASLLDKFKRDELALFNILSAHPDELIHDYFNHPRPFYFHQVLIHHCCEKSRTFLLCILNSPEEAVHLNGYNLEQLIQNDARAQDDIYQHEYLKNRHENYHALVQQLTDHDLSVPKTKDTYAPIMASLGEFTQDDLSYALTDLSQTHDHKILATNAALLMELYCVERFILYFYALQNIAGFFLCYLQ